MEPVYHFRVPFIPDRSLSDTRERK